MTGESLNRRGVGRAVLMFSIVAPLICWPAAAMILLRGLGVGLAIALFGSGLQGPLLAGYAYAVASRKQWWRWLVLASGGLGILMFSLIDAVDLDLYSFFELLILGTAGVAIGHTMVTTIVGPFLFGRVLCGWGCWRAMVLERLPVGKGPGRRKGFWASMPVVGIAVSLTAAILLAAGSGVRAGVGSVAVGVTVYYAASIVLAFALHDQRAFCKYLCPAGFILRWTSRPAFLHVLAFTEACNECGVCTDVCPMDVPVARRVIARTRISNGDCILCQRCVESCPTGALKTSFGRSMEANSVRASKIS